MKHDRKYLRAQKERKKNKIKNYFVAQDVYLVDGTLWHETTPRELGILATTPTPLSEDDSWDNHKKKERYEAKKEIKEQLDDAATKEG